MPKPIGSGSGLELLSLQHICLKPRGMGRQWKEQAPLPGAGGEGLRERRRGTGQGACAGGDAGLCSAVRRCVAGARDGAGQLGEETWLRRLEKPGEASGETQAGALGNDLAGVVCWKDHNSSGV